MGVSMGVVISNLQFYAIGGDCEAPFLDGVSL